MYHVRTMKRNRFSPRSLVIVSLFLVFAAAFAFRWSVPASPAGFDRRSAGAPDATSPVPSFTSAGFGIGDPLTALGPEWTFLRQRMLGAADAPPVGGVSGFRESYVKLQGKDVGLLLSEYLVTDRAALDAALASSGARKTTMAGVEGYLIPVASIEGGSGLALVGTTRVLFLQHGSSAEWPETPEPEIQAYIANVRVP